MAIGTKTRWFGWFHQTLEPPQMPDFMRKELERKKAGNANGRGAKAVTPRTKSRTH